MTSRVRALLLAALVAVVGPFALPDPAGQRTAAAEPGLQRAPVEHLAHPAPYGTRTAPLPVATDRLPHAAFAAAQPVAAGVLLSVVAASLPLTAQPAVSAPAIRLPHPRGPPHLS